MVTRFVIKIPGDISKDEMQRLIREQMKRPDYILSDEDYKQLSDSSKEKTEILPIINPFYEQLSADSTKENKAKTLELIDLGKFIFYYKKEKNLKIEECDESPDFIVSCDGERIGVEHTRLIDDSLIAEMSNIRKVLQMAREKLLQSIPDIKGMFNLMIIPGKIDLNGMGIGELLRKEPQTIPALIADHLKGWLSDPAIKLPDFIERITKTPSETLDITLSEEYLYKELNHEKLTEIIEKKEAKISVYKTRKSLQKCWLLIVLNGASADSSFQIDLQKLPPMPASAFDMVFIFDSFKGNIIWGKASAQ